MSDFAKMDVFFIVTTVGVLVLTLLVAFAIYYVVRILRHIEHISRMVDEESELIRSDIADVRATVRREGFSFARMMSMFKTMFARKSSRNKKDNASNT